MFHILYGLERRENLVGDEVFRMVKTVENYCMSIPYTHVYLFICFPN